uniref:Uncharacterized protein n=1 Tax=Anguilla anguilla TaxID=7936 RepID=A0A0E9SWT1_ANGAN
MLIGLELEYYKRKLVQNGNSCSYSG